MHRILPISLLLLLAAQPLFAQDMSLDQVLIDGENWEQVGEGYKFTEGPAADADGNVFFTDVPNNRIHKIDTAGKVTVFAENTAQTNGLMFGPDGKLYGCRNGEKKIVAYAADGTFETIANDVESNDIVVDSKRNIYFTDPAHGQVWYIDRTDHTRIVADKLRPNGLILTPDEGTLVITDSQEPVLWALQVAKDGSLQYGDRYYLPVRMLEGAQRPGSDGMAVDDDGRVYVATLAGVQIFDPTGRLGGVILKPQNQFLSNVEFGGTGFNFLYATCTDKVYRRHVKPTGTPYFLRHKPAH